MNAQPQMQPDTPPKPRRERAQHQSTETRLAIVETHWQDVIPTLATKADLADARADLTDRLTRVESTMREMKTASDAAFARIESTMREMKSDFKAEIKSEMSSQLRWVIGSLIACFGGAVAVMALLFSVMQPKQAATVQQQPAPLSAPAQATVIPVQPTQPVNEP